MNLQHQFNYLQDNYQTFAEYPKLLKKARGSPWSGERAKNRSPHRKREGGEGTELRDAALTENELLTILTEKKNANANLSKTELEEFANLSDSSERIKMFAELEKDEKLIERSESLLVYPTAQPLPFDLLHSDNVKNPLLADLKEIFNQEAIRSANRRSRQPVLKPKKFFNVLSFDGGGTKSLAQAIILDRLVQAIPDLLDRVDLFVGISAGSGLALGAALGGSTTFITDITKWLIKATFLHPENSKLNITKPTYSNRFIADLVKLLMIYYCVNTMEDVKSKVAIPVYKAGIASEPNSTHEATVVVTSWGPLKNTKLIDVAERTSAAPSYFAASKGYLDGGIISANPMSAVMPHILSAEGLNKQVSEIKLLSVGTPISKKWNGPFFEKDGGDWGIIQWSTKILDLIFEGSVKSTDNAMKTLLGSSGYCRIAPACFEHDIPLDDVSHLDMIEKVAREIDLTSTIEWLKTNW